MKKKYINPAIKIVSIRPMQMIAASLGVASGTLNAGDALGRQSSFSDWDDDYYDE